MTKNDKTIPQIIGANVRDVRNKFGITLDSLATELRSLTGKQWSTGRIGDIEAGRASPTINLLLNLSIALTEINKEYQIKPIDLLRTDNNVQLNDNTSLKPESFLGILTGKISTITIGDLSEGEDLFDRTMKSLSEKNAKYGKGVSLTAIAEAEEKLSLADKRTIKRLGIDKEVFVGACIRLWGHLLSLETERIADPTDSAQKKGRITRHLVSQLEGQLRVDRGEAQENEYEIITVPIDSESDKKIKRKTPIQYKRYIGE